MEDDGYAVHYSEVPRGTPVIDSEGVQVGTIDRVLGIEPDRILDGIIVGNEAGERRFVDAPEVARTAERAVTLTITAAELAAYPLERSGLAGLLQRVRRR